MISPVMSQPVASGFSPTISHATSRCGPHEGELINVPLLERCVKAGHRTLSGEDQPVEECEALHPHGAIGQVRETRRHTPAIEGRLSRRRAVPPLCKRKALCGTAAWERRVKLKAQGGEEKLREAGRVEHLVMGFG